MIIFALLIGQDHKRIFINPLRGFPARMKRGGFFILYAMKITEGVTIYQCEHCNKKYFRKHACEYHETICFHNPENKRQCFSCPHLTKKAAEIQYEAIGEEGQYVEWFEDKHLFYCSWYKHFLIPPITKLKGNGFYMGDHKTDEMPVECSASEAIKGFSYNDWNDQL